MNAPQTIATLHRQTGISRDKITGIIEAHGIETVPVGSAKVITPAGMEQLMPLLSRIKPVRKRSRATA